MNIEEQIRSTKLSFPHHVVDKVQMKHNVLQAVGNHEDGKVERLKTSIWRRWEVVSGMAGLLTVGSVFAVGFASPNAVNWPIVGPVFNLLRSASFAPPEIHQAALEGFGQRVNQSVTDHGITLKIGNVYCDQNQLEFDMVESSATDGIVRQVFTPSDLAMTMSVNGTKSLMNISGGHFRRTQAGTYAGVVYDNAFNQSTYHPFPTSFQLEVRIHQVGMQSGDWSFTIPISQARVLAATKVYTLDRSVPVNGSTITIQKLIVGPGQTLVDYEVSEASSKNSRVSGALGIPDPSHIMVLNGDTGTQLRAGGGGGPINSSTISGDRMVQRFQQVFITPASLPTSLTIQLGTGNASRFRVPLQ